MEVPKPTSCPNLVLFVLLLISTVINQSLSTHPLHDAFATPHHPQYSFKFYMPDVLSVTHHHHPSSRPMTTKVNGQIPFSKPLGLLPSNSGFPMPDSHPYATAFSSTQTLDFPGYEISFPARALQELEMGTVTTIDENLLQTLMFGSPLLGKAQGVYVASSEDGGCNMMAMTATFANSQYEDGLRLFGVHQENFSESDIAVVGGIGKYHVANGYATIKAVNVSSEVLWKGSGGTSKFLLFKVYLG